MFDDSPFVMGSDVDTMDKSLGFNKYIQAHFDRWGLTKTESEVGLHILKGWSLRQIAEQRGTTETTVRQQALSLYKKADVDGRHQLAAYFLEDLLPPCEGALELAKKEA